MKCRACGLKTTRDLCNFCARTVALIREGRCVSCTGVIDRTDDARIEGRCRECRSRNVVVSEGTRRLLKLAAKARFQRHWRYRMKLLVAA